jgi:hypothetical protein
MANETMVLLEKIVVPSAGASSVTFTSIPQSYTDLKIVVSARGSSSGTFENYILSVNGAQTNLSGRHLYGTGSAAGSGSYSSGDGSIFSIPNNVTANTFGSAEIYITNYSGSSNKSMSIDNVSENNATAGQQNMQAELWANTAAITSLTLAVSSSASFVQYSTFYLYGIAKQGVTPTNAPAATGGDSIVFDGTYWIHTFTSSGTFTPKKSLNCEYLVIAGGGGGASNIGGGGGAGGYRTNVGGTALSCAANTGLTVTVGGGGTGGIYVGGQTNGTKGSNSVFGSITSTGGGLGADATGGAGGSGGGVRNGGTAGTGNQGGYSPSEGNNGAVGTAAGGGGGAGAAGSAGGNEGGAGGNGSASSITGSSVTRAGGGGGGSTVFGTYSTGGAGGTGGGGTGGGNNGAAATSGTVNTGGGGGGSPAGNAGTGGSGIVIVRYAA